MFYKIKGIDAINLDYLSIHKYFKKLYLDDGSLAELSDDPDKTYSKSFHSSQDNTDNFELSDPQEFLNQ